GRCSAGRGHRDRARRSRFGGDGSVGRWAHARRGDLNRRQHRRGAGHQHRAHLECGVAAADPFPDRRRLEMTAIDEEAETTIRGANGLAPVIEISDVWKLHKLGDEVVRALVAAELQVMPGEFRSEAETTIRGANGLAPVIEISDVWKLHKLGDEVVRALVAAELQVMPGEF